MAQSIGFMVAMDHMIDYVGARHMDPTWWGQTPIFSPASSHQPISTRIWPIPTDNSSIDRVQCAHEREYHLYWPTHTDLAVVAAEIPVFRRKFTPPDLDVYLVNLGWQWLNR
jgi:hypothetical protein